MSTISVGSLSGSSTYSNSVLSTDPNDVFQFSLSAPGRVNLLLSGLGADANLTLLNSNGVLLGSSSASSSTAGALNVDNLAAGNYSAQVSRVSSNTNYNLNLTSDYAGNSLNTARSITLSTSTNTLRDFVGSNDTDDYYRFSLSSNSTLNLTLNGLSADANVQLIQDLNTNGVIDTGEVLQSLMLTGRTAESLIQNLNQGNYYIRVYPGAAGAQTNYNLNLVAAPITVTVRATDSNAAETLTGQTANPGQVTFTRTGSTATPLTVNYTVAGTATNGTDYNNLTGSITIPVGATSVNLPISVIDDAVFEGNETAILKLASNSAYTLSNSSTATITLADNERHTVTISATDASAAEHSSGQTANPGQVTFTRSGSTTTPLTVYYTLEGTATNGTDYQELTGSITIPVGATSVNLPINVLNDTVYEANETAIITLASHPNYILGSSSTATITLADNDVLLPDRAGNTISTAHNITVGSNGLLDLSSYYIDWVGSTDLDDYYRFSLSNKSNFNLSLSGLDADANVELLKLNNDGETTEVIRRSALGSTTTEQISIDGHGLEAGTYFVRVYSADSGSTNYGLSLSTSLEYPLTDTIRARLIDIKPTTMTYKDWVGSTNTSDYYFFGLSDNNNFSLTVDGLSADLDVELLQSNLDGTLSRVSSSAVRGIGAETININNLQEGAYYVRVSSFSGDSNYNLNVFARPIPPVDEAGNSTSAARDITLNSNGSIGIYQGWVGYEDPNDYYRFNLSKTSNLTLNLYGLLSHLYQMTADADVQLLRLNSDGTTAQVGSSSNWGGTREQISINGLTAGTYYVRVHRPDIVNIEYNGASTDYELSLSTTPVPDYGGNSVEQARSIVISSTPTTYKDWLDSEDTDDYYKFSLSNTNLYLKLDSLSNAANVQLLKLNSDKTTTLISSSSGSNATNNVREFHNLASGTYVVRVYRGSVDTYYNLSLAESSGPQAFKFDDDPGENLGTAELQSSATFSRQQKVSPQEIDNFNRLVEDLNDFYRFAVTESGVFTAKLTGLTGDADVRLIQDKNNNGVIEQGEVIAWQWERGTADESIRSFLHPGTYFLQVMSYNNQTANYNLTTNFDRKNSDDRQFSIRVNLPNGYQSLTQEMINALSDAAKFWQQQVITHSSLNEPQTLTINIGEERLAWRQRWTGELSGSVMAQSGPGDRKESPSTFTKTPDGKYTIPREGHLTINNHSEALKFFQDDISLFRRIMIHEIGHVLGIGNFWGTDKETDQNQQNLVDTTTATYAANTYAGWAYGEKLGTFTPTAIPIYDNGHWNPNVFPRDILSSNAKGTFRDFSQMTIASLRDLGWNVNYGAAQELD